MIRKFVTACLLFMALPIAAYAADVDLTWQAPTQNVDGTALTDLDGFAVYIGQASRDYTVSHVINDETATTATVTFTADWLQPGGNDVYIAMTAFDSEGNESVYSNEIIRTVNVIDDIAPNAPAVITITITVGVDCPSGYSCGVQ